MLESTARLEILSTVNKKPEVLYKSSILSHSSNPTWTFSGLVRTEATVANLDTRSLLFRVVLGQEAFPALSVLSEEIDLTRLVPLKYPILNGKFSIPTNFLIINIEDQLYTSEKLFNTLFARSNYVGEVRYVVQRWRVKDLRKTLISAWAGMGKTRLQVVRDERLAVLEALRLEVEGAETDLQEEQKALDSEKMLHARTEDVSRNLERCRELVGLQREEEAGLNLKKMDLLKVKFLLQMRQVKLLGELQGIYPIERLSSGEFAIRGVELSNDLYARDDEQVAAALGYLVHMLMLASKYLEVPLRYQPLFMGSRSFLRDPVVGNGSTLPLFRRNVDKERFDRAVVWLKRDIEQLLVTRGVTYEPSHHMLLNAHNLFLSEMSPKLTR
ncbi:hypothetical protein B484DRAFT_431914 [Ochromonadaceae sp. CCMP2298]|nr:hypothetical protein B484DRAFT_431914 [Ochromonadaceae sp. CCMP2298]